VSTSLHPTDGMLMPVLPCTGAQLLALPEEEAVADLDGDREHIEQADRFEASFNFRFEVRLRRWGHHPLPRAPGAIRAASDHCLAPCVVRNVLPPLPQQVANPQANVLLKESGSCHCQLLKALLGCAPGAWSGACSDAPPCHRGHRAQKG